MPTIPTYQITCDTPDAEIHYEVEEYGILNEPTLDSLLYTEPFTKYSEPSGEPYPIIKARAFKDNYEPSDIAVFEG